MGCCSSSDAGTSQPAGATAPPPSSSGTSSAPPGAASNNAPASSSGAGAAAPTSSNPSPPQEAPATTSDPDKYEDPHSRNPRAHPDQQDQQATSHNKAPRAGAAPTGGTYRGWAPPTKEQFSETASKGQKKRITVEDQWDEDGNLTRVTTTKTFAPDWKTTTQKEFIPAAKAAEMGIVRKNK